MYLFIIHLLSFQQIHIIYDGGQRRLNVVGHIGNQVSFHALILHTDLHGLLDAFSDAVDGVCQNFVISVQLFRINLMLDFASGYGLYPFHNALPLSGILVKQNTNNNIYCAREQHQKQIPRFQSQQKHEKIKRQKDTVWHPGAQNNTAVVIHLPDKPL